MCQTFLIGVAGGIDLGREHPSEAQLVSGSTSLVVLFKCFAIGVVFFEQLCLWPQCFLCQHVTQGMNTPWCWGTGRVRGQKRHLWSWWKKLTSILQYGLCFWFIFSSRPNQFAQWLSSCHFYCTSQCIWCVRTFRLCDAVMLDGYFNQVDFYQSRMTRIEWPLMRLAMQQNTRNTEISFIMRSRFGKVCSCCS